MSEFLFLTTAQATSLRGPTSGGGALDPIPVSGGFVLPSRVINDPDHAAYQTTLNGFPRRWGNGLSSLSTTFVDDDESVSPYGTNGNIQRTPVVEALSSTSAICIFSQRHSSTTVTDGQGMRLVQHLLSIDASLEITVGEPTVFDQPANWTSGLGWSAQAHLLKIPSGTNAGRLLCVFNRNDDPAGTQTGAILNVYLRYSDDNGVTWSSASKIIDHTAFGPTSTTASTGANGDFFQIPSGTYAGRLCFPMWGGKDTDSSTWAQSLAYSDNGGATWSIGGITGLSGSPVMSENTLAYTPGGKLVMTIRNDTVSATTRYRTVSTDGGATWSTPAAIAAFSATVCNSSTLQIGSSGDGTLVWAGPTASFRNTFRVRQSTDAGVTWTSGQVPFPDAQYCGYNSIKLLKPGVLLMTYETANTDAVNQFESIRIRTVTLT